MKIIVSLLLIVFVMNYSLPVLAIEEDVVNTVEPPKWEEYVPYKYQNPRSFPHKGKNIAELSVGIFLTDLLITAPIGVPMICHATTKMKNQGWYEKKIKFEEGLKEAEKISDPAEKEAYYKKLLKQCKLTEEKHQEQLKRMERRAKRQDNADEDKSVPEESVGK